MVPEGWMLQPLGSLINFINGKAHENNIVDSGQFALVNSKFISTEGLVKKYTDVALCPAKKNDVLIVMSDVPNGRAIAKCFFVTTDNQYTVNQRIGILRAKICNPKFLYYTVNRSSYFLKFDDGITQTNLRKDEVLECPIRVPPLSEQKKIAQILSTWDKAITTTEQLLANSQQQKKALMQQLLTGKKRLLDNSGVRFSGEWKWLKVSDLLKVRKEKQVPTKDVPLFSLTIEDGITPKSDRYNREFLVKNTDEKKYKLVKPKDIVYNPANLRWGAINFSRMDHSVVVSPIYEVLFLKDKNKTTLEFIAQKLMTPDQIGRFAAMVEGTLVERMAVKIEPFLATKLSVPPTLEEQQKIAAVLSTADQEVSALQQKLDALKQEKKALMQQLLTGKRRVLV
jgi:type I restriction enzyme, S subunit